MFDSLLSALTTCASLTAITLPFMHYICLQKHTHSSAVTYLERKSVDLATLKFLKTLTLALHVMHKLLLSTPET